MAAHKGQVSKMGDEMGELVACSTWMHARLVVQVGRSSRWSWAWGHECCRGLLGSLGLEKAVAWAGLGLGNRSG